MSTRDNDSAEPEAEATPGEQTNTTTQANWPAVQGYLLENKINTALWLLRVFTVVNSILYLLPFWGPQFMYSSYRRAVISSAATSALRLHQRMPNFQFSKEYLSQLILEDSCHYLIYSLAFLMTKPVTLVLFPIALFALLHTISFTKKLLDILGTGQILGASMLSMARNAITKVETHQQGLLRFIACSEILLMPSVILMLIGGTGNIILPFVYYRFLCLRYTSRRNPYSRILFQEFRFGFEQMAAHPRCPRIIGSFLYKGIAFVSRMAPAMVPQAAPQTASQQTS